LAQASKQEQEAVKGIRDFCPGGWK